MKTYLFGFLAALSMMWFAGCSEMPGRYEFAGLDANVTLESPEQKALADRVLRYWDARSRHDFKTAYDMELPYDRFLKPFKIYKAEGASLYKGFHTQVMRMEFDPSDERIAWVFREYRYDDRRLPMRAKWIRVNGTWYHKYNFSVFPQTAPLR